MILHEPIIEVADGRARLIARVESRDASLPRVAYFDVDEAHTDWLAPRADAFAGALWLAAMFHREALEVRAPLSPLLADGLSEVAGYMRTFFPNEFAAVRLVYSGIQPVTIDGGMGTLPMTGERLAGHGRDARPTAEGGAPSLTACGFSGGVDSMHIAWKRRPAAAPHPTVALGAALFAHGYNVPLEDPRHDLLANRFRPLLAGVGVELVPVRTNLRAFLQRANWARTHGAAIAALGHATSGRVGRMLIASSRTMANPVPWGSDARLDSFHASERLEVLHDENALDRLGKVRALLAWPEAIRALHCCEHVLPDLRNCGRCLTCIFTLACLRVAGHRGALPNFAVPWRDRDVALLTFPTASTLNLGFELAAAARDVGELRLAASIRASIAARRAQGAARYLRYGVEHHARRLLGARR